MKEKKEKSTIISVHKDVSYEHVLKYTGIFGGVQGLKMLITLVRNKLTARFLGQVGMGLNAVYANVAEVVNSATNFGIAFSAVRHLSEVFEEGTQEQVERYICVVRTWCMWTAMLASVLCLVASPLLSYLFFDHSLAETPFILLLSIMLFVMPIEAGECAILKGVRKLKTVAVIESVSVFATLLTTIPFYMMWGIESVVYSLVLTQVVITGVHLYFSVKVVPYKVEVFSRSVLHEGIGLIRLGIPYVLAAFAGSLTTTFIFGFLEDYGQIGLYKAGYTLLVTCAGMVFTAVDADYFPRLSAVNHNVERMNKAINQQMEVCLMLVSPILIAFILALPVIIPLLYRSEFLAVVPMCIWGSYYMFFRCITIPLEYVALAKGDSKMYLLVELFYDLLCVLLMRFFVNHYGLTGAGMALSACVVINILVVYSIYHVRYRCVIGLRTVRLALMQLVCLSAVVGLCWFTAGWMKYGVGAVVFVLSSVISLRLLGKESNVVQRMMQRFRHHDGCNCG